MVQLNADATGRQNVGRVDHVVYAFPSQAARDRARADYVAKFGFDNWMEIGAIEDGNLHVVIDWDSGIELVAPLDQPDGDPKGRGTLRAVVFGVSDLDAAIERANANGARTSPIVMSERVNALIASRFSVGREAFVAADDLGGIPIILGEFAPLHGYETVAMDGHGRKYPGAVDHLVFAFADLMLLETAVERMNAVLGVDDWLDLGEQHGLRIFVAERAALEFICPSNPESFLTTHVERNGPVSFFAQVISVADFDTGVTKVLATGGEAQERPCHPLIRQRHTSMRHAGIGRVGTITTTLSEVVA